MFLAAHSIVKKNKPLYKVQNLFVLFIFFSNRRKKEEKEKKKKKFATTLKKASKIRNPIVFEK